ncbi:unnamed protein product [Dicrocoelium dendriticum]|nr:unnamed protein product [Dicrocoelium dendriticum]
MHHMYNSFFQVGVRTSELAAIFLATFENNRGTVISHQFPEDYVSSAQFKEISNVVLPRAELAFRLITVDAFQHYVIGCPQRIEGDQYQRNTLQFNICLVLKPKPCSSLDDVTRWQFWHDQPVGGLRLPIHAAYEALVLKINRYFHAWEEECGFLSTHLGKSADEQGYMVMSKCLESIFRQLHADGTCVLDLEGCGSLYLRFIPGRLNASCSRVLLDPDDLVPDDERRSQHLLDVDEAKVIRSFSSLPWIATQTAPPTESEVTDECVFVLVDTIYPHRVSQRKAGSVKWKCADFFGDRILPYLDGRHCLPELARLTGIDVTVARLYLLNLVRIGVVRALPAPTFLVPVHITSDNHLPTFCITMPGWLGLPRLATLLTNRHLAEACLDAIHCHSPTASGSGVRCSLLDAFRVYTILCGSPNFSLPHLISATPRLRFVDLSPLGDHPLSSSSNPSDNAGAIPSISLLRLVQFGEINGLIHRLKCYPIGDLTGYIDPSSSQHPDFSLVDSVSSESTSSRTPKSSLVNSTLSPMQTRAAKAAAVWTASDEEIWTRIRSSTLDGLHSVEAIGCRLSSETGLLSPSPFVATELVTNRLHGGSLFRSVEPTFPDLALTTIHSGHQKAVPITIPTSVTEGDGTLHTLPSMLPRANRRLSFAGKGDASRTTERSAPIPEVVSGTRSSLTTYHDQSFSTPASNPSKVPHVYWLLR